MTHPASRDAATTTPDPGGEGALARRVFSDLPDRYDLLAEVLSFGQNRRWRDEAVARAVEGDPARVLDVATGTGGIARRLAQRCDAAVTGIDVTEPMLRRAVSVTGGTGLDGRIGFLVGGGERLPFPDATFDAVTFGYLLRYVEDPADTIRELFRVTRPGGIVVGLEFHVPDHRVTRALWLLYTRAALPALGAATGGRAWYRVGRFLGANISEHRRQWPLDRLSQAWRRAGAAEVDHRIMSLGGGVVTWGRRGPTA